jgi:hypothetical protein
MKTPAKLLVLLFCLLATTAAKKPVSIPPCDCTGMAGEARWAAKTDPQPAPLNTATIPRITPAEMYAWPVPAESVPDARMPAEQQWYAVLCRIVAIKIEADGDLHVEVENTSGGGPRVVVELPCGPAWCEMRKHVVEWTKASLLRRGRLTPVNPHNVTVIGKAFYDVDHARGGKNDRGGKTPTAVWEIHPVMKVLDGDVRLGSG